MTKKYTNAEYQKFLQQPFTSNFGIDFDTVWADVSNTYSFKTIMNDYGISANTFKDKAIPNIKRILGENSYFMILMIMMCEPHPANGGRWDFINWTYRENIEKDSVDVSNHIKDLLNSKAYPPAFTAPEVGGSMSGKAECQACLNSCPLGSIGRYYIPSTLAGNAWVWSTSWAQGQYFGNPYDDIIDYIKSKGKDPFNAGSNGSGSSGSNSGVIIDDVPDMDTFMNMLSTALAQGVEALKKFLDELFPKAVYLNNSKFSVLGIKFRRYQQYLYLTYPWQNLPDFNIGNGGEGGNGGNGGDPSQNPADWYQKMVAELDKVRNKKFTYANVRPQPDLLSVTYADCSGFVGWIARTAFPDLWRGGSTNTANQKASFDNGSIGKVVIQGSQSYVASRAHEIKAGDFLLMGQNSACGAGLASHVAWVETPDKVWSMEGTGLLCYSASYFLNTWWTAKPYMSVCRPNS